MRRDPAGIFDALASLAAAPTVFLDSDASPTASAVSATLNGSSMTVSGDGKVALAGFLPATNVLVMTVVGVRSNDDIHLVEACPDGTILRLKQKFIGFAPGGADPVVSFRIHAS